LPWRGGVGGDFSRRQGLQSLQIRCDAAGGWLTVGPSTCLRVITAPAPWDTAEQARTPPPHPPTHHTPRRGRRPAPARTPGSYHGEGRRLRARWVAAVLLLPPPLLQLLQ
jgi:hypothetical protein